MHARGVVPRVSAIEPKPPDGLRPPFDVMAHIALAVCAVRQAAVQREKSLVLDGLVGLAMPGMALGYTNVPAEIP